MWHAYAQNFHHAGSELTETFSGVTAENYACVRVVDTGTGMTKQVKSHIFEPFFSTKERGKGTGLGLSVVYGVVNNHRGFVQVESEPGAGTSFIIYLPVKHSSVEQSRGDQTKTGAAQNIPQTILLVEDEDMLRDLGVSILESEGFHVLPAKDGVEAVALFEAHGRRLALVVCDLGLPTPRRARGVPENEEMKPNVARHRCQRLSRADDSFRDVKRGRDRHDSKSRTISMISWRKLFRDRPRRSRRTIIPNCFERGRAL